MSFFCVVRTSVTARSCGPPSAPCRSNWPSRATHASRCVRRSSSSVSPRSSSTSTRTRTWSGGTHTNTHVEFYCPRVQKPPPLKAVSIFFLAFITSCVCFYVRFGVDCQTVESSADIVVPAYSDVRHHCIFQSDLLLFSCAGAHPSLRRICPCRDYMKGQVALCKDCL